MYKILIIIYLKLLFSGLTFSSLFGDFVFELNYRTAETSFPKVYPYFDHNYQHFACYAHDCFTPLTPRGGFVEIWRYLNVTINQNFIPEGQNYTLAIDYNFFFDSDKRLFILHLKYESADTEDIYLRMLHRGYNKQQPIGHENLPIFRSWTTPNYGKYSPGIRERYILTPPLDVTLQEAFEQRKEDWSMLRLLHVTIECLKELKYMHSMEIIHRDITAKAFRTLDRFKVVLASFEFAAFFNRIKRKVYKNKNDNSKNLTKKSLSQRDDLLGVYSMMIYFYKNGNVSLKVKGRKKYLKLVRLLRSLSEGLPQPYHDLLNYAETLEEMQIPVYDPLINSFQDHFNSLPPPREPHGLSTIIE